MGNTLSFASWLQADKAGKAAKHFGWLHPAVSAASTIAGVVYLGLKVTEPDETGELVENPELWRRVGKALLCYISLIFAARIKEGGPTVLYELIWQCNLALCVAAAALLKGRPTLLASAATTIAIDQMLWYVDILGFLFTRKWPIGVAAYLTWPETPFIKNITATHHIWFIPLILYLLRGRATGFPIKSLGTAIMVNFLGASFSRLFAPRELVAPDGTVTHLNINLAHECWKDIKIPFLHTTDNGPAALYIPHLMLWWNATDLPFWVLFRMIVRFGAGARGPSAE